jgi:2,4-dienoyl-CoA reductase-like NADH-dependent reductase (Old Yellow Enzyme family)
MAHQAHLFTPLTIKDITFKNRIWMSPMCQYSSRDGHPTDWHFVHLGTRAVGGAGLIMVEATAVNPDGRISPDDSGIWSDDHIKSFQRITEFVKAQDAVIGIQLAHAGRKGSTDLPWLGGKVLPQNARGWETHAPSAIPFIAGNPAPRALTQNDIAKVINDFEKAAVRSLKAGFQVLELHMAHGYLMHEFLSPLANQRQDEYGGSLENRMRLPLQVAQAVRKKWPTQLPLFARISTTDWAEGPAELTTSANPVDGPQKSWNVAQSIILARQLKDIGVDLIDCSSGGTLADAVIPVGPSYQVPFCAAIRHEAGVMTAAVGMITDPVQAEAILHEHQADAIFMAREFLRNPYWPQQASKIFNAAITKPNQYARA